MNQVIPFQFNTHEVRTLSVDGDIRFVATDVAQALEYRNASDMVRCIDPEDKGYAEVRTPSGTQKMLVINESGIYAATFRSKKPSAKPFRRWVTADVLPSIRRTGGYTAPQAPAQPQGLFQTPEHYQAERARLEAELEKLAATPIALTAEQYNQLTGERIRVGKKDYLVAEMVNIFDHYGIPRKVAEAISGLNNNTIRQHALIGRRRTGLKK